MRPTRTGATCARWTCPHSKEPAERAAGRPDPQITDECWGQAASTAAHRLLADEKVNLVFEPTQGRTDAYGRTLAYLKIPGIGDYGAIMVRRGHAIEYTYESAYKHQARYRRAESEARAAERGLWRHCGSADIPLDQPAPTHAAEPVPTPADGCAPGDDPRVPPYRPDMATACGMPMRS